ncbi:hypothetical protein GC170_10345 [bacterium]|nr:hypothetical protein [bacterium]
MTHAKLVVENGALTLRHGSDPLHLNSDSVASFFEPPAPLSSDQIRARVDEIVRGSGKTSTLPLTGFVLPGDTVAIPVSGQPDEVCRILLPLIAEFGKSGTPESAIRIICQSGSEGSYREILPSTVSIESHDPDSEEKSAYLANSRRGSRVYLNREMLDCDVIVPVIVPDPVGMAMRRGVPGGFWPEFSRKATQEKLAVEFRSDARKVRHEIREVAWLAGVAVTVVGLPGSSGIAAVAGIPPAEVQAWVHGRIDHLWGFDFEAQADSVLLEADAPGGLCGERLRAFLRLAGKLAARYRRVVLCLKFDDATIEAMEQELRTGKKATPSWNSQLKRIGTSASVSLLGNLPDDIADECEIVLLEEPEDVERQVNHAGRWIVVPDAWAVRARFEN